jgi:hypothetical protein
MTIHERAVKARASPIPGDWLSKVLDHHERIETAFEAVKSASNAVVRFAARKRLVVVSAGHAMLRNQ